MAINRWMPKDSPLADKDSICVDDLVGLPLFCSEQAWGYDIPRWCGDRISALKLEGTFRLAYNGAVFAHEGLGYMLTYDHLVDTSAESGLVFRPLDPPLETEIFLIWKKREVFTPIVQRFIAQVVEKKDDELLP